MPFPRPASSSSPAESLHQGPPRAAANRRGYTDPEELAEFERRATALRYLELLQDPEAAGPLTFDFDHLRRIHRYTLQDVYDWAGEIRTGPTLVTGAYHDDGSPLEHIPPAHVPGDLRRAFAFLADYVPEGVDLDRDAQVIATHYAALTRIHPFADGNSRSQRHFFTEYAAAHRVGIDWSGIDAELVHAARMTAHATGNHQYLAEALREGLVPLAQLDRDGSVQTAYRSLGDRDGSHPEFFIEMMENERLGAVSEKEFVRRHSRARPQELTWIEKRRAGIAGPGGQSRRSSVLARLEASAVEPASPDEAGPQPCPPIP